MQGDKNSENKERKKRKKGRNKERQKKMETLFWHRKGPQKKCLNKIEKWVAR